MVSFRQWILCGLVAVSFCPDLGAQGTPMPGGASAPADPNSFRFSQPIPVTIRRSNNAIAQGMLVAITPDGITVMTAQGRSFDYTNKTFRSVRSLDGSFFYNPTKDDPAEFIQRLNQAHGGAGGGAGGAGANPSVPFTVTGTQPMGGHGQTPAAGHNSTAGQTTAGQTATMPAGGHSQSGIPTTASAAEMMNRMMAHSQQTANNATATAHNQATAAMAANERAMAHAQTAAAHSAHAAQPTATMPMPTESHSAHNSTPFTTTTTPMNSGSHGSHPMTPPPMMPPMTNPMGNQPGVMMYEYECSKCKHRVTSSTEIKAGHRCASCGVVWGQVQDENGRVTSSTPAARIGGGVGIVVTIIGIIAAIVKKSKAA